VPPFSGFSFFLVKPVVEVTPDSGFINELRFGNHRGIPAIRSKENTSYSVAYTAIPAALMQ
jgi:hypothetical protein